MHASISRLEEPVVRMSHQAACRITEGHLFSMTIYLYFLDILSDADGAGRRAGPQARGRTPKLPLLRTQGEETDEAPG